MRKGGWQSFIDKLSAEQYDKFTCEDLLFYFKQKSDNTGIKFVITNKAKGMKVFANLLKTYNIEEVMTLIDYYFSKEQTWIDVSKQNITALYSGFTNRLYTESQKWAGNDREWNKSVDNTTRIGDW